MKTLTSLLTHRAALIKQARLANLAYAYQTLSRFEARITRGACGAASRSAMPRRKRNATGRR
jgi:hypothetical protein